MAKKSSAKRRRKKLRRLVLMACFVLVTAWGMVQAVEWYAAKEAAATIPAEKPPVQQPNTDITKQLSSWADFDNNIEKTINFHEETAEINMIQVQESHPVDVSYFNDAIFMGDSLADGFRVYNSRLTLKDSTAVFLTQKSTSPRSFLQPGAMIDSGRGLVKVWDTISEKQPGKMYITLGTNALMGMSPEDLADSYGQLIDKIRETTPGTMIYVTTITPTTQGKAYAEPRLSFDRIYQSNILLAKMCRDKGIGLINLYEVLKNPVGYLREDIAARDGYHLNPSGYQEWLDYLICHTSYNPANPYLTGLDYKAFMEKYKDEEDKPEEQPEEAKAEEA